MYLKEISGFTFFNMQTPVFSFLVYVSLIPKNSPIPPKIHGQTTIEHTLRFLSQMFSHVRLFVIANDLISANTTIAHLSQFAKNICKCAKISQKLLSSSYSILSPPMVSLLYRDRCIFISYDFWNTFKTQYMKLIIARFWM